jgi:hypothetical protein
MISDEMKADKNQSFGDKDVGTPVEPCQTSPSKKKRRVWIVQWMRDDYPGVKACDGASTTHELRMYHPIDRNWNTKSATRKDVLATAGDADQGDIFLADAHGAESAGTAVVGIDTKCGDKPSLVKTADLASAFKKAAIVLLFGCRTGEILKDIVDAGTVKLAFGVMSDSGLSVAGVTTWLENSRAAEAATTELVMGKALKRALSSGQAQLTTSKASYDATVVLYPLDKYDDGKSLESNGLL